LVKIPSSFALRILYFLSSSIPALVTKSKGIRHQSKYLPNQLSLQTSKMLPFPTLLLLLFPLLALGWHDHSLPSTCFIGKICAGGFGQAYTIYENYPDLTVARPPLERTFEVSQTVGERDDWGHEEDRQKPIVAPCLSTNPLLLPSYLPIENAKLFSMNTLL
jgi:hypothetical protein